MKRRIMLILAIALAFSLVMGACGGGETVTAEPASDPEPTAPSEPAAEPGDDWADTPEHTLILTNHDTDQSLLGQYAYAWGEMVYQASKGRIEVQVNNGGGLAGPTESLDKVRGGSVDLAWGLQSFYGGQFPLSDGLSLPYLPYTSSSQASKIAMDIWENTDLLDAEYADVKVILLRANSDAPIITASKKLETAADMGGMTVRATANPLVSWLAEFGANGQGCPIGELFQNLAQGTFDGALTDWHAINSFQLYDAAQYFADEKVQYNTYYILMNLDAYNRLPADLQAVVDECSGQAALDLMLTAWDEMTDIGQAASLAAGCDIYKLPDEENQKLRDAADKINAAWAAENGAAGQAILDAINAGVSRF